MHSFKSTIRVLILLLTLYLTGTPAVHALSIAAHVPEKYTDVFAGERFYFELDIKYPENPIRKDLRLTYEITKDGELIAQSKVLKAVENQASFVDFIVIPENAETGLYLVNVSIQDYGDLAEEVSASFHVVNPDSQQLRLYFFILLGAILVVVLISIYEVYRIIKL